MSEKTSRKPLRILIVDDHLVVRMGLSALISLEPGMSVVGEAEDGEGALELVEKLHPDVVVIDIMIGTFISLPITFISDIVMAIIPVPIEHFV